VPARQALELVALRGKDVLGVRHILDGRAHVGSGPDAIARMAPSELGGGAPVIAEVAGGRFLLRVPPRARARLHGADGLGRLLTGPTELSLREGDRAVLVLGPVQIRAQIVPIEIVNRGGGLTPRWAGGRASGSEVPGLARWICLVGALYAMALAICAALAPRERVMLEPGAIGKAAAAAQAAALGAH
jgi:hypothetical protein